MKKILVLIMIATLMLTSVASAGILDWFDTITGMDVAEGGGDSGGGSDGGSNDGGGDSGGSSDGGGGSAPSDGGGSDGGSNDGGGD